MLEDPRVDPSSNYNEAIRYASYNGRIDIVNRLLRDFRVRDYYLQINKIFQDHKNIIQIIKQFPIPVEIQFIIVQNINLSLNQEEILLELDYSSSKPSWTDSSSNSSPETKTISSS